MECKVVRFFISSFQLFGFNRYIVECKVLSIIFPAAAATCDLIDTLWNVKAFVKIARGSDNMDLIDTLWNVKKNENRKEKMK